jgi:hypothetical protein
VSWWVPFAFVGAAIVGIVIAFSLTAGRSRPGATVDELLPEAHGARRKSRYEQDNELVWNKGAFFALAALIGLLVLIAVLTEVV